MALMKLGDPGGQSTGVVSQGEERRIGVAKSD